MVNKQAKNTVNQQFEGRLDTLQDHFDLLQAQVRQAQQQAVLGTAATTIAHEVNNLLTPILSYATAALGCDDSDLRVKALEVTVKHVKMLIAMSDKVLHIGAAHRGQRETVSVREVVDGAIESLCRDLARDGITLTVDVEESLTVEADSLHLQQVLFNLFLNAREAMAKHHGGQLRVVGRRTANMITLEITNTGDPIPAETLPIIFDPFQSSKALSQDGQDRCRGLGLALCRDLIEENGGDIKVHSTSENGTTFTILFPVQAS